MGHLDCWGSLPAAWHSFSWLSLTFVSRLVWSSWWLYDYSVPRWLHKPKSSYLHHRAWHLVSGVYTDLLCLFGFWLKCCCALQPSTNILLLSVQRTLILKAKPRCHPNKLYVFSLSSSALMNFNFNMLTEANWNVALVFSAVSLSRAPSKHGLHTFGWPSVNHTWMLQTSKLSKCAHTCRSSMNQLQLTNSTFLLIRDPSVILWCALKSVLSWTVGCLESFENPTTYELHEGMHPHNIYYIHKYTVWVAQSVFILFMSEKYINHINATCCWQKQFFWAV